MKFDRGDHVILEAKTPSGRASIREHGTTYYVEDALGECIFFSCLCHAYGDIQRFKCWMSTVESNTAFSRDADRNFRIVARAPIAGRTDEKKQKEIIDALRLLLKKARKREKLWKLLIVWLIRDTANLLEAAPYEVLEDAVNALRTEPEDYKECLEIFKNNGEVKVGDTD